MAPIYLDHNATSPCERSHWDAIRDLVLPPEDPSGHGCGMAANASSPHSNGRLASSLISEARNAIGRALGVPPGEIIFTASATEGNNTIIRACGLGGIVLGSTEHPSVRDAAEFFGTSVTHLPPLRDDLEYALQVVASLRPETTLLSIMSANNETGQCFPVKIIGDFLHEMRFGNASSSDGFVSPDKTKTWSEFSKELAARLPPGVDPEHLKKLHFHVDATQSFGKCPAPLWTSPGIDSLTLSGHKVGALSGAGVLVVRRGRPVAPLLRGGGQERFRRAGTENVAAITSLGRRAQEMGTAEHWSSIQHLRARAAAFENALRTLPHLVVLSDVSKGLPNTVHAVVTGDGITSEDILIQLDMAGISASSGSACSSGTNRPSKVIEAALSSPDAPPALQALSEEQRLRASRNGLRFSLGTKTSSADLERTTRELAEILARLAKNSG